MSRVAIILLILIENVMTSSFYSTTWIDVELRTHCKVRGYQDSNYHRTGSEDLLIGDPFTPRYDLKFPHLAAIIFCLGPIIINLRQGEREWGGGQGSGIRTHKYIYICVCTIYIYIYVCIYIY